VTLRFADRASDIPAPLPPRVTTLSIPDVRFSSDGLDNEQTGPSRNPRNERRMFHALIHFVFDVDRPIARRLPRRAANGGGR
jgi:hypothetical protein